MRVAVLGAAGTIAPAIVRDLAESEEAESILLLDLRGEVAEQVATDQGGGKATARSADARGDLADCLAGIDALVNSASYRVNLDAMRACLEAGCHYLDLGGLYRVTGEQLALHADFERAGLLAILGIGSSPGKTNLMAAHAVAALARNGGTPGSEAEDVPPNGKRNGGTPGSEAKDAPPIDRIDVMAAGRDLDPPEGFSVPYALQTLVDELTQPPVVLRDGKPNEIEPLADGGEVDFGEPIGVGATILTLHSELRTFAESFGCSEGSFRLSLAPALLDRLRDLAHGTPEEVHQAAANAKRPSSRTISVHLVAAAAGDRVARMRALTQPHEAWGLGGGVVSTAAPAAAAVRLLARGGVEARGALPPERCLDPEQMFAELETRGSSFELELKEGTTA